MTLAMASLPTASETSQLLTQVADLIAESSRATDLGAFRRALLVGIQRLPGVVYATARRLGSATDAGHFVGLDEAMIARVRRASPASDAALAALCARATPPTCVQPVDVAERVAAHDAFAVEVLDPLGTPCAMVGAAWHGDAPLVSLVVGTERTLGSRPQRVVNAIAPLLAIGESRFGEPAASVRRTSTRTPMAATLTPAELDLLRYVALGLTNREIATARGTSPNTVKNQLKSIFQKVGAANRPELVQLAHEMGLLSADGVRGPIAD
jgi:DNA-binding CsgD family transcriptional regulator